MAYEVSAHFADAYAEMLKLHYSDFGLMFSADELLAEHGFEMTPTQKRALIAFIQLWDAIDDLERSTHYDREVINNG